MDETEMKIAVIGAGYWGKNLVRVFAQLGVLDTVCDINTQAHEELKKTYPRLNWTTSYADVLNNKTIKAVVISTPARTHYCLTKEALLAGKDVFTEKPLAVKFAEGKELVELAEEKRSILMVGHLLEYHPGIAKLKELIDKNELGRIQYIYSHRLNLGKIRREENILWSFAPHDISVILSLLKEVPESVSAYGGNYLHKDIADVTVSNLNFRSGVKGHIFVSWLHPYKEQKLIIIGAKKMAVFDDVSRQDKLLLYSHKIDWTASAPVAKKEDAEKVDIDSREPLLLEAEHFLQCVQTRKAPRTDGQSALKVLAVLEAAQISLDRKGEAVLLENSSKRRLSVQQDIYVHPTSIVDELVTIGQGTKIWHYSHIMTGAKIGEDCVIGQNVFIGSRTEIGSNVKIQNNVSIYDCVTLEDDVFCGPSVVFTNVINPRSHICRKNEFKATLVKKGATIGANATILCGHTIGEYAFIGAGSVVTKDVPAYGLVYGNSARLKGWICRCGVRLNLQGEEAQCAACKQMYVMRNNLVSLAAGKGWNG